MSLKTRQHGKTATIKREYPGDWDIRRRRVYKRDGYSCQNCGRRGGRGGDYELHAHHIVPKSKGGSHHVDNLITLCKGCHAAVHNKDALAPDYEPPSPSPLRVKLVAKIVTILSAVLMVIYLADLIPFIVVTAGIGFLLVALLLTVVYQIAMAVKRVINWLKYS